MRSGVVVIALLLLLVRLSFGQTWSDNDQYAAYLKGDWKQVVSLGKQAKKQGVDYYYIRARNGYAYYQLGRFRRAEREFEKALKFNSTDAFSKRYGYWSSFMAGNTSTALLKTARMSQSERDTFQVISPKSFTGISIVGGYRVSTSQNVVGNMPYAAVYLGHQIGRRITVNHGISYLNQNRSFNLNVPKVLVWQIGYLISVGVQVAEHTTVAPSFAVQHWQTSSDQASDLFATLAVRQQFGSVNLTAIGGYFSDSDTNRYVVGGSLSWFPLGNNTLYTISSAGYNFGGRKPNPFFTQTVGGRLFKRGWIRGTFSWNQQVLSFEDISIDFANNSLDRVNWKIGVTPTFYPIDQLGVSLTYALESRLYFQKRTELTPTISDNYNIHSFYLGLNYIF
jgi:tetratricopeptide (TPR) repeat protein